MNLDRFNIVMKTNDIANINLAKKLSSSSYNFI